MNALFSSKISLLMPRLCLSAKATCTIVHGNFMEFANLNNSIPLNGGGGVAAQTSSQQQQQVRYRSNRSRRGLYNGKDIRTGNNVSFSMRHTKRKFRPNVFIKRVYSEILDSMIPFHLTASTLRSIDKAGGLDPYLLNNDDITEGEGLKIKKGILKRLKNQAYFASRATTTSAVVTDGTISAPDSSNEPTNVVKIEAKI